MKEAESMPMSQTVEGDDRVRRLLRVGVWALPVYGVLLAVSTVTHQPDPRTDFSGYADYVTTAPFLISHLVGSILGAALGVVGVGCAVMLVAARSGRPGRALLGGALTVVGNVVNSALFGVAAFAQPAIGRAYQSGVEEIVAVEQDVYGPEFIGTALAGLAMLILGAVLVGGALRRSADQLRVPGLMYAIALPLFVVSGFTIQVLQPVSAVVVAGAGLAIARRLQHTGGEVPVALGTTS